RAYMEWAPSCNFSVFVDLPWRFINPEQNANANGFGDMFFGGKAALINNCDTVLSGQLKAWMPTGDPFRGLGNDHLTLEPGVLLWRRLSERVTLEAQVTDWIPIGGSDFAGNVLNYGIGLSFAAVQNENVRIGPVVELMGWTVLSGHEVSFPEG